MKKFDENSVGPEQREEALLRQYRYYRQAAEYWQACYEDEVEERLVLSVEHTDVQEELEYYRDALERSEDRKRKAEVELDSLGLKFTKMQNAWRTENSKWEGMARDANALFHDIYVITTGKEVGSASWPELSEWMLKVLDYAEFHEVALEDED